MPATLTRHHGGTVATLPALPAVHLDRPAPGGDPLHQVEGLATAVPPCQRFRPVHLVKRCRAAIRSTKSKGWPCWDG